MHSWRVTRPAIVLGKLWHIRRDLRKKNNGTENVDQLLMNSQVEERLSITDIPNEMSDRQSLLTEDLKKKKIHSNLLHNIQKELLKEWKIKATSSGQKLPEEEILKNPPASWGAFRHVLAVQKVKPRRSWTLIAAGLALLLVGCGLLFSMVIGLVASSLVLSILAYVSCLAGLAAGLISAVRQRQ